MMSGERAATAACWVLAAAGAVLALAAWAGLVGLDRQGSAWGWTAGFGSPPLLWAGVAAGVGGAVLAGALAARRRRRARQAGVCHRCGR